MHTIRCSLVLLAACVLTSPAYAIVIEFDPAADTVSVGDAFAIDIVVSGLDAAGETVSAFDLFIGYDPAIIAPVTVALGPGLDAVFGTDASFVLGGTFDLGFAFLGTTGLSTPGPFSISALPLLAPLPALQGDSVLLATLTFDALTAGFGDLTFLNHPFFGVPNVTGNHPAAPLAFERVGSGAITVEAVVSVAEPGTLMLLGMGLLLAGTLKRRVRGR